MKPKHTISVAIIGAGVSAATLARHLREVANITVFEKSRGASGRMATRYHDNFSFDHGAPFFTARSTDFKRFIQPWVKAGHIVDWPAKAITLKPNQKPYRRNWFEPHYVAAKKMNQWCKALLGDIEVNLGVEITDFERLNQQWILLDATGNRYGAYDWVISTAPSHQAAGWLPKDCSFWSAINAVHMTPAHSLMLGFTNPQKLPNWDIAKCIDSPLRWVVVENSKPGRANANDGGGLSLTLHSTPEWSSQYLDIEDQSLLSAELLDALAQLRGELCSLGKLEYQSLHRWRYASVARRRADPADAAIKREPASSLAPFYLDPTMGLAAAGDWCLYGDVDSAYCSGNALAKQLISHHIR